MQKDGLFQKIIQIMVQMDFQLYISAVLHLWKMFCIIFIIIYFNIIKKFIVAFSELQELIEGKMKQKALDIKFLRLI